MNQLDGLRAVAMLAICWDHWWAFARVRWFPFEVFLFFFLVMTGYLITGSLLRERDRREAGGMPWRMGALRDYQVRRGLRILAPYYASLALAFVLLAPDVWTAPFSYLLHVSNIHMATLPDWPSGTNHYWSLAMQQQFYLVWPFVIWFLPRRAIPVAILATCIAGPAFRAFDDVFRTWFVRPDVLTTHCLDYFGCGALLGWARHRGMAWNSPMLKAAAWAGLAGYLALYAADRFSLPHFGLWPLQSTCISLALCGFLSAVSNGLSGWPGRFLELPWLQKVGMLSYGLYLYHNLAPLLAGKLFWFLWSDPFDNLSGSILKLIATAGLAAALTIASWRWIEQPLQQVRARMGRTPAA